MSGQDREQDQHESGAECCRDACRVGEDVVDGWQSVAEDVRFLDVVGSVTCDGSVVVAGRLDLLDLLDLLDEEWHRGHDRHRSLARRGGKTGAARGQHERVVARWCVLRDRRDQRECADGAHARRPERHRGGVQFGRDRNARGEPCAFEGQPVARMHVSEVDARDIERPPCEGVDRDGGRLLGLDWLWVRRRGRRRHGVRSRRRSRRRLGGGSRRRSRRRLGGGRRLRLSADHREERLVRDRSLAGVGVRNDDHSVAGRQPARRRVGASPARAPGIRAGAPAEHRRTTHGDFRERPLLELRPAELERAICVRRVHVVEREVRAGPLRCGRRACEDTDGKAQGKSGTHDKWAHRIPSRRGQGKGCDDFRSARLSMERGTHLGSRLCPSCPEYRADSAK